MSDVPTGGASPTPSIQQYRIERLVHEGANARVYRAFDETLRRTVALKVLAASDQARQLLEEARAVSALRHPSIANVYQASFDERSGCSFIAFEWAEGETLRARLQRGPLSASDVSTIGGAIAAAVAHAHERSLVHGDLKADNVVLSASGEIKLIDFGLSRPLGASDDVELWGTPAYMAPELFEGSGRSEASDLFALGVLLYEMATGVLPFGGANGDEHEVVQRLAAAKTPDPRERIPETPTDLASIVTSLLRRRPEERGPGAAELARLLRVRVGPRPRGRSRSKAWFALLCVLALASAGWWFRDSLESGLARLRGSNSAERVEVWASVFRDPGIAEVSSVSQLGSDLVNLFLHGEDPGSTLLARPSGSSRVEATDASTVAWVEGEWGLVDGQWQARLELPKRLAARRVNLAGGVLELRDPDSVQLAKRVAEALQAPASSSLATTLCDSERALVHFAAGVRALGEHRLERAGEEFESALREGKYFPEAEAWSAVTALLSGQDQVAAARILTRREIPSRPGATLAAVLGAPRSEPTGRWGADHAVARTLDLILAGQDPRMDDAELDLRLQRVGRENPRVAFMAACLRLREGDLPGASEELLAFRARGGKSWEEIVLRRWWLALDGRPETGNEEMADWLLNVYDGTPGSFLRIPLQLASGKVRRAGQLARRKGYVDAEAIPAVALTLAIAGEFDEAADVARGIRDPFDPGAADRVAAAIAWLRGSEELARKFLEEARRLDPNHPKATFLLGFVDAGFDAVPPEPDTATAFGRWRVAFERLARGRAERVAGRADSAISALGTPHWVNERLEVMEWPELGYLIRLEAIEARIDLGETEEAAAALIAFRDEWPADRPGESRVSRRATEVGNRLTPR